MTDQELTKFEHTVDKLIVHFKANPEAADRFFKEANQWPVPTWENDPGAAERFGVKLEKQKI